MREQVDDEENDDEDMGVAETYSDYMPPKCELNIPAIVQHAHG